MPGLQSRVTLIAALSSAMFLGAPCARGEGTAAPEVKIEVRQLRPEMLHTQRFALEETEREEVKVA